LTKSKGKPRTNTNKHQKKHQKAMENPEKSSKIMKNHRKSLISPCFFCTKVVATPPLEAFDAELVCRHEEVHGLGWWF
jgi:hypothetical protein